MENVTLKERQARLRRNARILRMDDDNKMAQTTEMEVRSIRKVVNRPCTYTTDGADDGDGTERQTSKRKAMSEVDEHNLAISADAVWRR